MSVPVPRNRDALGLLLISVAILSLQVASTRLFSFMLWYHFAFLVISVAFLGFTSGGLLTFMRRERWAAAPQRVLERTAFAAAGMIALLYAVASRSPLETDFLNSVKEFMLFVLLVAAMIGPFFCFGLIICLCLSAWQSRVHRLYAVNMIGSGVGCGFIVVTLNTLGVPATIFVCGLLAWIAGLCFSPPGGLSRYGWGWRAGGVLLWVALIFVGTNELHPLIFLKSTKFFPKIPEERIIARASDSLSTVDFFENPDHFGIHAISSTYPGELPEQIGITIDSWAITSIFNREDVEAEDAIFEYLPASLAYKLGPAKKVLVIGCGGGVDVLAALHFGAERVTGIDINPIIVNAVRERFRDFAGDLYGDPRVDVHVSEGRHYLKRAGEKYDIIQLSGVDTFAASQAGAFALHENYLYTVEALHDYLDALNPGGIVTLTRWLYEPPRQTLKLMTMLEQALRERGDENPERHIAIIRSETLSVIVIKNGELSEQNVQTIFDEVRTMKYDLVYAPHLPEGQEPAERYRPYYDFWQSDTQEFIDNYVYDVRPSTDTWPFFFEHNRWTTIFSPDPVFKGQNAHIVLLYTFALTALLCLVILAIAAYWARHMPERLGMPGYAYFVGLGLGYILVENVLIQRIILYLGSPAYALSVILFSMLVFSGVGSALAGRWTSVGARWVIGGVVALLLVYMVALTPLLQSVLAMPLSVRIVVVVALIAPLATLMGMPFPMALARLGAADERLVAWAWVANGAASVLGSVVAVIGAITFGFTFVFVLAALVYAGAAVAWPRIAPQSS